MLKNLSINNKQLIRVHIIIISVLTSCMNVSAGYCDASSESVAIAKAISNEQASDLYNEVKKLVQSNNYGEYKASDGAPIPSYLWNYEEITLIVAGKLNTRMYIETCSFDSKVAITFDFPENGTGEMVLQWGGGPEDWGQQLLWPKE